jgi:hypothetical protein
MLRRPDCLFAIAALAAMACSSGDVAGARAGYQVRPDSLSQGSGGPIVLPDAGGGRVDKGGAPEEDGGQTSKDAGGASKDTSQPAADEGETPVDEGSTVSPLPCRADQCEIDGACYENGTANPKDPCQACLLISDPSGWSLRDEAACDDGDPCTDGDRCFDGSCSGKAKSCDDSNECTTDACEADTGACAHAPVDGPCDDGDLCTLGDTCEQDECHGEPLDCDDGEQCTEDSCDSKTAECLNEALGGPCDDGDPCTTGEECAEGACLGAPTDCDDGDLCTIDACVPVVASGSEAGGCAHTSVADVCADDNPCTDDRCDPALGCVVEANAEACDDGNVCTKDDVCTGGACRGTALEIDDGNPCTDDICDPVLGPIREHNEEPCEDGSVCTLEDLCEDGECAPGPGRLDCDDNDPCTADSCSASSGCSSQPVDWVCDDGDACTEADRCSEGVCSGEPVDCEDRNDCTADSCDSGTGCRNDVVLSNACRPNIAVDFPPRGATVLGDSSRTVAVTGAVTSGAGPISSFTIGGEQVAVAEDGSFQMPVEAIVGGNPLVFAAEDAAGGKRDRVQAYLWSTAFLKPLAEVEGSGMADPGVGIFLGQEAIDDGDHSLPPDDLATIFEMVLKNYPLSEVLPEDKPVGDVYGTDIFISNLRDQGRSVSLVCRGGSLLMTAVMSKVVGDVRTVPPFGQPMTGAITIDALVITSDVVVSVIDHELKTDMTNTKVDLQGLDIDLDAGRLVNWILDRVIPGYANTLEAQLAGDLERELEPILQDAFSSLAFNTSFELPSFDPAGEPIEVHLQTDFSSATVQETGITFRLRSRVVGPSVTPWDNLGLPRRRGCAIAQQVLVVPGKSPFEMVLSDNLLNQIFFAAWNGGMLEMPLPADLLADVDLGSYGVTKLEGTISGMLAPTLSDCGGGALELLVGDLRIDLDLEIFGSPGHAVIFATFATEILIDVVEGTLGLSLGELLYMEVDVSADDSLIGAEGFLKDMIGEAVGPLLTESLGGGTMAGFPLPRVDLSETVDGLPPGTGIGIDPKTLSREGGNTIVGGDLQ